MIKGSIIGVIKGDTRRFDYSSSHFNLVPHYLHKYILLDSTATMHETCFTILVPFIAYKL